MLRPLTDEDRWLMGEGRHTALHQILGCRVDESGASFRIWAPSAAWASVVGNFNKWNANANPLISEGHGFWHARIEGVKPGDAYKFQITSTRYRSVDKADPFAVWAEVPPRTASRAWNLDYQWNDDKWMTERKGTLAPERPISIYEVHLGSWRHNGNVNYRTIAPELAEYVLENGFTHVEFLPLMEHPFYGSWGYQATGFFAPTARYGTPQDLMYLVDHLHQNGIGVLLDWVASNFATDLHGLAYFDGTHLYEHPDPRRGYHPEWTSLIFDYDRGEVRSFLISSVYSWLDRYHLDGLRVDGVASMLYLDYARQPGQWIPNEKGGREHLGAVELFRQMNAGVHRMFPGVAMMAEESSSWPHVTGTSGELALGFDYKWDMGWMNDTLRYATLDPLFRSHPDSHRLLTFRSMYAYNERYTLALSHDEVVYGKRSLVEKQWGPPSSQLAGLRTLFGLMWTTPGKKLLFMGGEFGQNREWNHDASLQWELLDEPAHRQLLAWVKSLNGLLQTEPALCQDDNLPSGFQWLEADDYARAVFAYLRRAEGHRSVMVVLNFTPVRWNRYLVGAPASGEWSVLLSSDDTDFGGEGLVGPGPITARGASHQGQPDSLMLDLPPLSAVLLVRNEAERSGIGNG